jgi:hypothetical protein
MRRVQIVFRHSSSPRLLLTLLQGRFRLSMEQKAPILRLRRPVLLALMPSAKLFGPSSAAMRMSRSAEAARRPLLHCQSPAKIISRGRTGQVDRGAMRPRLAIQCNVETTLQLCVTSLFDPAILRLALSCHVFEGHTSHQCRKKFAGAARHLICPAGRDSVRC